jgi:hypothetical protein
LGIIVRKVFDGVNAADRFEVQVPRNDSDEPVQLLLLVRRGSLNVSSPRSLVLRLYLSLMLLCCPLTCLYSDLRID